MTTPWVGLAGVCVGSAGLVTAFLPESVAPPLPTAAIIAARTWLCRRGDLSMFRWSMLGSC